MPFQTFTEDGQTFWVEIDQPVKKPTGEVQVSLAGQASGSGCPSRL